MKSNTSKLLIVGVVVAGLAVAGVFITQNNDDESTPQNIQTITQKPTETLPFTFSLTNLAPLEQGSYEGWIVRGDEKTSFGTFNMTESGDIDGALSIEEITPEDGDMVAISIEPTNDSDPEPSETIILSGVIRNGTAELEFPVDISEFSGQYNLATPTTSATDDETAGLWFTITGSDASLDIPVAPDGWAYEGWAVVDGTPLTSGLFTDPAQADFFNDYSGPESAPDKPGEDFITNLPEGFDQPQDLRGATIVVSLEPYQDGVDPTGQNPSQIKPLSAVVADNAVDHTGYDLMLSLDSLPRGSVTL